jgi:hypothetical protein
VFVLKIQTDQDKKQMDNGTSSVTFIFIILNSFASDDDI